MSRPAGAASRLVGLHTPPSTAVADQRRTATAPCRTRPRPRRRSRSAPRAAEHDPATAPPPDGGDAQPAIEPRLETLDTPAQVVQRLLGVRQPAQEQSPRQRSAGRGEAERERRERGADGERPLAGAAGGGNAGGGEAIRGPVWQFLEVRADRRRRPGAWRAIRWAATIMAMLT